MFKNIVINYKIPEDLTFQSMNDLDQIFDLIADSLCCEKVGGGYHENGRFVVYSTPDEDHFWEFKDMLDRLQKFTYFIQG